MSDRYDPKLSVRPLSERRPEAPQPDDDPLAELARIVTGRSTFDPPPAAKSKTVPAADSEPGGDLGRDLESELLNDLQASFAALREPFEAPSAPHAPDDEARGPAAGASTPPPQSRAPEGPAATRPDGGPAGPGSEDALEEVLAGLRSPPPPPPPKPTQEAAVTPRLVASPPRPAAREPEPEPPPPPPAAGQVDQPPVPRRPADIERPQPVEPPPPAAPAGPVAESGRPPAGEGRDFSRLRLRPAPPVAPPDDEAEARVPPPSRWDRPDNSNNSKRTRSRLSRFAPRPPEDARAATAPQPVAAPGPEPEPAFDEPPAPEALEADFEDSFTLEDLDAAAFAPEDDLPPFPEEELAGLKRRRTGRALAAIGGLLVIVLVGGAAYLLLGNGSSTSGPPPIITADATPNKVAPDEPAAGDADQQGKLIYDRVDEGGSGSRETRLVTSGDDTIADIPPVDEAATDNPISRVIIPGGPGIDGPIQEGQDAGAGDGDVAAVISEGDAPADESDRALGPKKVRTVVVRPDGTIVSSEAVDEGSDAMPAGDAAADGDVAVADPADAIPSTRTDMDAVLEGQDLPVNTDPLAMTGPEDAPQDPAGDPAPGTVPAGDDVAAVDEVPEPPAAAAPEPAPARAAPAAKPATPQRQKVASTGNDGGPIDLTGSSARSAGPNVGSGGVLVQVSAQRTEDAARSTYRTLQARYPGILGPYQAAIIRADLGDKGVYYRVRIGPFSNNDAARLCNDLKAAGGDCILAR